MSLHIGDRILEVNGTPVKDTPLENVENLIRYSDTVLQLTIEHDPEAISRRRASFLTPITRNLTTTSSETNIQSKNFGSNSSVNSPYNSNQSINEIKTPKTSPSISPNKPDRERLFKRRDEGYMSGTRSRQLRRRNHLLENKSLDKERSSSMSRLLDE